MKKTLFFAAFLCSFSAFAQNAEEIINKHLAATGADKWAAIKTIKMEVNIAAEAAAGMKVYSGP